MSGSRPGDHHQRHQVEDAPGTVPNHGQFNLREGWISAGLNWPQDQVNAMIRTSPTLQHLLQTPVQREVFFTSQFSGMTRLTFQRLTAVVYQSRGDIINAVPCTKCNRPYGSVFTECISKKGFGNNACGSDLWHNTGSDCAYNTNTGMVRDAVKLWRGGRKAERHAEVMARFLRANGIRTAPDPAYDQSGLYRDLLVVNRILNPPLFNAGNRPNPPATRRRPRPVPAPPRPARAVRSPAPGFVFPPRPTGLHTPATRCVVVDLTGDNDE